MTITLLVGATTATGQQLDDNWRAVSQQAPIPCAASGTDAITLTQLANVYTVPAYVQNMQFSAVATASNDGPTTARLGALESLAIYKDTAAGPVALAGGEIVVGCAFTLLYDSALNSGSGGFHLFTTTAGNNTAINPSSIKIGTGSTLSRYLSATASVSFTVFGPNSSQESIIALSGIRPNDAIQVGPPSMSNQALSFFGYVTASGSVALRAVNAATASVTLAAGIFRVTGMG